VISSSTFLHAGFLVPSPTHFQKGQLNARPSSVGYSTFVARIGDSERAKGDHDHVEFADR